MASQPYLPLYTGDWKKDPQLSMCSAATRGIWIDLLCSIHDGRIGQVTGTADQLSRLGRCDAASMTDALHDLQANQAASISERNGVFTVICRRMKKACEISLVRQQAGGKGGSKTASKINHRSDNDIGNDASLFKIRLGNLFRRREATAWSEKEETAYRRILLAEDDLSLVERYYSARFPAEKDYRRRDLLTLLNNWTGEVDRSRAWCEKNPLKGTRTGRPAVPEPPPISDEEFQREGEKVRAIGAEFRDKMRNGRSTTAQESND